MNINDPSLYAVTPREMSMPFVGGHPFAWQNAPQFVPPFQGYGMPLQYGHAYPYGYPSLQGQYKPPFMTNPFATPYSYMPYQTLPFGGTGSTFPIQGWQRPFWY